NVYMQQVHTYGAINRDPGERVISTSYFALVNVEQYDHNLVAQHNAEWVSMKNIPPLIFDHNTMVNEAYELMRNIVGYSPVGFNLLPELFTLPQLQSLYEAISGYVMDKRNFRKRIAEMPYIEKTDAVDKSSSRRGAYLYRLNMEIYNQMQNFKL
ncbi:MAG: DNA mismatch repair protein MutT, partial [Muribaculaceae bacterium]|nr:DNA mismatch repair protein MutT [Muribaculaceae bacterium]